MKISDGDWQRLADYVESRRRAQLGMTQRELAEAAGAGLSTIQLLERGVVRTRLPNTTTSVEAALGWLPGSFRAILRGDEPTLAGDPSAEEIARRDREDVELLLLGLDGLDLPKARKQALRRRVEALGE